MLSSVYKVTSCNVKTIKNISIISQNKSLLYSIDIRQTTEEGTLHFHSPLSIHQYYSEPSQPGLVVIHQEMIEAIVQITLNGDTIWNCYNGQKFV